jgi:uncharacterized OsmC-like protein/alpha/beta superfamily hydrolase
MLSEKVEFPGASGAMLAARLDRPDGQPRAWALFAHCFTCSKDSLAASRIGRALAERGFAVLRFDFTGLGGSDGDFANTDFTSNIGDLLAAVAWLRSAHSAPALLIGHSLGGAAVLAAAGQVAEAVGVVTLGAPFEPAHVKGLLAAALPALADSDEAEVDLAGRRFRIRRGLLDDLERQNNAPAIAALGKALLVMHSPHDTTVPIDNARRIYEAAKHPKSFVSLDHADHLLTGRGDAQYAADVLAAWASRYLPVAPADASEPGDGPAAIGGVQVTAIPGSAFGQHIASGTHRLIGDEPVAAGGTDLGLSPYDYLLAALGTCTSMTIELYARAKAIPLEGVQVSLNHAKIHAADCTDCETRDGRIDRIERTIRLDGVLSEEQRAKLMAIADKCPVHRTLHSEVSIVSRQVS